MTDDCVLRDVLIIGAGPCGLAVAARLRENTPSAIFTEEEHARYHWIRRHGQHANILSKRHNRSQSTKPLASAVSDKPANDYDTLVIDATASKWMARWNYMFKKYEINHLRSPMFFHVDPGDRDGLLSFAHEMQLQNDLREIKGCVGKEVSKHKRKKRGGYARLPPNERVQVDERDRKDYFVPSQDLFECHCQSVADRYCLHREMISREQVHDIAYVENELFPDEERVFEVRTSHGMHYAKTVVAAVGNGDAPRMPPVLQPLVKTGLVTFPRDTGSFPSTKVREAIAQGKETQILIVGGGLTSAQMADLAIERGVTKVWLLVRGDLKVKPFDVDQTWISKYKNHEQSVFWSADTDEERLEKLLAARNGGSITPPYHATLRKHIAAKTLALLPHTQLASATLTKDPRTHTHTHTQHLHVTTTPASADLAAAPLDHIYCATGAAASLHNLPFLATLQTAHPVSCAGGLPRLTEDLAWRADVPLFVTGALAGLRLGPGAGNLGGARLGAERVVWGIKDVLGARGADGQSGLGQGGGVDGEGGGGELDAYVEGLGSRFASLGGLGGD